MLSGGCYCGAIRYQAQGPASSQSLCHCAMCQGTTGAPCVAWFTVPRAQFQLISGNPTQFRSSNHATRSFCPACGTQLTFADDALPDEIDITTCSLDDAGLAPPKRHLHTQSQVPWLKISDGLPAFSGSSSAL